MGVVDDATAVLVFLGGHGQFPGDTKRGRYSFDGPGLQTRVQLDPDRLNDAVSLLEDNGYVEVGKYLGSAPFEFGDVELSSRGRVEFERVSAVQAAAEAAPDRVQSHPEPPRDPDTRVARQPMPVGSPYGFQDEDWESVTLGRADKGRLIVVFGHQWESKHFNTEDLRKNVGAMFGAALSGALAKHKGTSVQLDYRPLQGGYGGHLFNEIARDIIGADIAVFDTSDQNSNVMIEMGVALTWGTRVLPIREDSTSKPPSDISGQTWATYRASGSTWLDVEHAKKLQAVAERALKKKGGI